MTRTPPAPTAGHTRERRAPDWLDVDEYPFDSRYVDVGAGELHYVDEGSGRPIVMLHGNPTWSYLYRDLIGELSEEFRCIAPDYLGFGLSDRPKDWSYRVRDHAEAIRRFVRELELTDVTFVLHDWGGPIAAQYATSYPEDVDSFVVLNSAAWPLSHAWQLRAMSRLADTSVAEWANQRYDLATNWFLPRGFGDRDRWTPRLRHQYEQPLSDPTARGAALTFVRELTGATTFLEDIWRRRPRIAGSPALVCWGMQDPFFRRRELERWQALFPDARTVEFEEAGHFLQEERPEELVEHVREFLHERPEPDRERVVSD